MDLLLLQGNSTDPIGAVQGFWDDNGDAILTLLKWAIGILVYGLLVNAFYQVISRRVMFAQKDENGQRRVGGPGRGFLYLLMFPLISFLFFLLLSGALMYLGDAEQDPVLVLTLSMSLVLAVRVAAYFNEPTSHDLAKMLPLGFLGVFLVRANVEASQTVIESLRRVMHVFDDMTLVLLYFGIVVIVEYMSRAVFLVVQASTKRDITKKRDGPKKKA
jgi:hypothetical protein